MRAYWRNKAALRADIYSCASRSGVIGSFNSAGVNLSRRVISSSQRCCLRSMLDPKIRFCSNGFQGFKTWLRLSIDEWLRLFEPQETSLLQPGTVVPGCKGSKIAGFFQLMWDIQSMLSIFQREPALEIEPYALIGVAAIPIEPSIGVSTNERRLVAD